MAHNKYSPTYSSVYIMFTLCLSLTKRSTLEDRDLCLFCLLKSSWHIVGAEKPFMDWISMATVSLLNDHTSRLLDLPLTTPAPFSAVSPAECLFKTQSLITCRRCCSLLHAQAADTWTASHRSQEEVQSPDLVPVVWPAPPLCSSPSSLSLAPRPLLPQGASLLGGEMPSTKPVKQ